MLSRGTSRLCALLAIGEHLHTATTKCNTNPTHKLYATAVIKTLHPTPCLYLTKQHFYLKPNLKLHNHIKIIVAIKKGTIVEAWSEVMSKAIDQAKDVKLSSS
jgi:hypothetical protein